MVESESKEYTVSLDKVTGGKAVRLLQAACLIKFLLPFQRAHFC